MTQPISKLFEEAQATCVEWQGDLLYGIYEMSAPEEIQIELSNSKTAPVQGLNLKAYDGFICVNGVEAREMIIWADTAPDRVVVNFKSLGGRNAKLKIWNVWRGKMGGADVTQAWLGNAGMRVEIVDDGKKILLRCSDGEGPVDFSDIEACVIVIR